MKDKERISVIEAQEELREKVLVFENELLKYVKPPMAKISKTLSNIKKMINLKS